MNNINPCPGQLFSLCSFKMFICFNKEGNRSQQEEFLLQCHLKETDQPTCTSSNRSEQNDAAYDSSQENSRPVPRADLYTPPVLCQQRSSRGLTFDL